MKDVLDEWKREVDKKPPEMSVEEALEILGLPTGQGGWVYFYQICMYCVLSSHHLCVLWLPPVCKLSILFVCVMIIPYIFVLFSTFRSCYYFKNGLLYDPYHIWILSLLLHAFMYICVSPLPYDVWYCLLPLPYTCVSTVLYGILDMMKQRYASLISRWLRGIILTRTLMDGTCLRQSIKLTSSCAQDHPKCVRVLTLRGLYSSSLLSPSCINAMLIVSLSVCLSICLCVYLSVCLSVCKCCLSVCLSICLFVCLSAHLFVSVLSVCLLICLSVCLSLHLPVSCIWCLSCLLVCVCICACLCVWISIHSCAYITQNIVLFYSNEAIQVCWLPYANQDHWAGDQWWWTVLQECTIVNSRQWTSLPYHQHLSTECWRATQRRRNCSKSEYPPKHCEAIILNKAFSLVKICFVGYNFENRYFEWLKVRNKAILIGLLITNWNMAFSVVKMCFVDCNLNLGILNGYKSQK